MSCISRLWVAAGVAVVNSHSEQGQKLKYGLRSLNHGRNRFFSGADLRPLVSGIVNSDVGCGGGDEQRRQAEESLRQVMYMNCWGKI